MAPACQNQPTKVPPSACEVAPFKLCLGGMSIRHKTLTRLATRLFSQCLADLKRCTQSWSMHFRNFQFIAADESQKLANPLASQETAQAELGRGTLERGSINAYRLRTAGLPAFR